MGTESGGGEEDVPEGTIAERGGVKKAECIALTGH
jgi:hypothetical protein